MHTQLNNLVINPLRSQLAAFDPEQTKELLDILLKHIEKIPYGGMDELAEKSAREEMTTAIHNLQKQLNYTNLKQFIIGPLNTFWLEMTK